MNKKVDQNRLFLFLMLFFLSLLFYYFSRFELVRDVRSFFERPVLLLQREMVVIGQKVLSPLNFLTSAGKLNKEKEELEKQLAALAVKAGDVTVCLEENESLRKMLAAPLPPSWHFIPAKVIGFFGQVKLNVGEKAGVETGMTVIAENLLVGRVVSVEKYSSLIEVYNNQNLKIPALVRSVGEPGIRAKGIVNGSVGDNLMLEEVLKSEILNEEDLVFSSGEGGWLPDLLIGQIATVEEGKEKVFKKAQIKPFLDINDLRYVFVVKLLQH